MPGRITRWKGQEDFIEIIAKLRKNHSNIIGLIVGDVKSNKKNFLNELKQKVEQLGVEKNIVFIEHRSDLREIMSISKIVFSLSKEPEAFGRTTIESLKLGIPVIGYSHGGVGEQLKEVFPQGQIGRKNKGQAVLLASKWIIDPPKVAYSKLFSLNEMLENENVNSAPIMTEENMFPSFTNEAVDNNNSNFLNEIKNVINNNNQNNNRNNNGKCNNMNLNKLYKKYGTLGFNNNL